MYYSIKYLRNKIHNKKKKIKIKIELIISFDDDIHLVLDDPEMLSYCYIFHRYLYSAWWTLTITYNLSVSYLCIKTNCRRRNRSRSLCRVCCCVWCKQTRNISTFLTFRSFSVPLEGHSDVPIRLLSLPSRQCN